MAERTLAFIRRVFERSRGLDPDASHEDPAALTLEMLYTDNPAALMRGRAAVVYAMQVACALARTKQPLTAEDEDLFADFMESADAAHSMAMLEDIVRVFGREMEWRLL